MERLARVFGDGSFKSMRGNAPVPTKALVRALAKQGLTFVLDEYRTSTRCPECDCAPQPGMQMGVK